MRRRHVGHVHKVNKVPFKGPLPTTAVVTAGTRSSRSSTREGARRQAPRQCPSYSVVLATITEGCLRNVSDLPVSPGRSASPSPGRRRSLGYNFIPFTHDVNNEPIITLQGNASPFLCFIDTGSGVDLIPRYVLDHHFPGWSKHKISSNQKLVAANNKPVFHQGRVAITLPLPLHDGGIKISPFIVDRAGDENTMILGYETMRRYGIIPIPGSGCMTSKTLQATVPTPELWQAIQRHPVCRVRNLRTPPPSESGPDHFWIAKPCDHTFIPAFKRTNIFIKPRTQDCAAINSRNGEKVLVRECPCVSGEKGEECEACIRSENQVQMCTLINGRIKYTVDNTHSGCTRTITPKTSFYITFNTIFNMKTLAEQALEDLDDQRFEFEVPRNQYSEQECDELFNKTKEEVTKSLRSIVCEPSSWSLQGYRPETLRLINSEGKVAYPTLPEGDPISMAEFPSLNPCPNCQEDGDSFCNMEREDCDLRRHMRRKELPESFESILIQHETSFQSAPEHDRLHMIIGCHRVINRHASAWDQWYPKPGQDHLPRSHLRLHKLCDAVITEVSKAKMLQVAKEASELKVTDIHFTNFHAYGISLNLLQRCIPGNINLHVYPSKDIAVAGPGYDPRKRQGLKLPSPKTRECSTPPEMTPSESSQEPPPWLTKISPGLPKPIRAQEVQEEGTNNQNILTDDPDLRRRCIEMLDSHKKVFSSSPSDCGQYIDPESGLPFLFRIRLKGV